MSSTNDDILSSSAGSLNVEGGRKIPTFSFTEAVKNLDLNRFHQHAENFSEATENFSGNTAECANEFEILREYMDDQLEELCYMQIEHTLEQLCGLANESLVEVEEDLWDHGSENAICVDYNSVEYNDIESYDPSYEDLDYVFPEWNHDIDYSNNINVDCLSPYERESVCRQRMKKQSIYEQSSARQHAHDYSASMNHYYQRTAPISQMVESHLEGFAAKEDSDKFVGKRRLCRHFLKGRCNRGDSCDFLHDESIFCSDEQKVFLGGLPSNITDNVLREALSMQGYRVLNKPKVLQGFSPQICLGSVQEAQLMVRRGKILIAGEYVDVRPYEAFVKDGLKISSKNIVKRSVFLGGLPSSTTGWMIKERLAELGFTTANHPVVKSGFAPQVMLESEDQARRLVELKRIKINQSTVEIRPYSRYRV